MVLEKIGELVPAVYADMVSFAARAVVSLRVLMLASLLTACGFIGQHHPGHPTRTDDPVVTGEPAGYNGDDVAFVSNVTASDQQGADLASLVPSHSATSDVVAFAAQCASDRQSDVAVLRALSVQWQENPDTKSGSDAHGAIQSRLVDGPTMSKLNFLHGSAFDTEWLQSMRTLDRGLIDLSDAEVANGKNVDAIGIAKRILQRRQREMQQIAYLLGA